MKKAGCSKCNKMAVWLYAPATQRKDVFFCEEHVPRGCSCNAIHYEEWPIGHPNAEPSRDEKGREWPCVEYDREEDGWDADVDDDCS